MEKIIPVKLSKIFKDFFQSQQASGFILIFGTIASLVLSNSQFGENFIAFGG